MTSNTTTDRPLIIIVSGAPGSGKSTLARNLADYMRLPHIARDEVIWGWAYTRNSHTNRHSGGIAAYYEVLVDIADRGVSLVTDGTLYKDMSEADIKTHLAPVAKLVNIHCHAEGELQRFYDREFARHGRAIEGIDRRMTQLEADYERTSHPLDLGCIRIEVDTTKGYQPTLKEIANIIGDRGRQMMDEAAIAYAKEEQQSSN